MRYISVEVDVFDVIDAISDGDLIKALDSRKINTQAPLEKRDDILDAYNAIMRGEPNEAALILHAVLFPRFKSPDDALAKLVAAKNT